MHYDYSHRVRCRRGGFPGWGTWEAAAAAGRPHRGGRRARRGDIRFAILLLLDEEPRNGYGLMQEIEERSGGIWRPSPGSVYPALSQLEDEGLVRAVESDGRRMFELTAEGKKHVEANRERVGTPWKVAGEGATDELQDLRRALYALASAVMQLAQTGSKEQLDEGGAILEDARRRIYGVLAGE